MPVVDSDPMSADVAAIRHFNRFYTRTIGVLQEGFLQTPFSLTEGRVLYELARNGESLASDVCDALQIDPGYMSRIVRAFEQRGLLTRAPSPTDARQQRLLLSPSGRDAVVQLDTRARDEVSALLTRLSPSDRRRLVAAMRDVESILGPARGDASGQEAFVLRAPEPGDMGWVVHRQGILYAEEYGWTTEFEALAAKIVSEFVQDFDPDRERCWIAERFGQVVGAVFLVTNPDDPVTGAKLRLLYVEASARGLGIGARLVDECTQFAREVGYRTIRLWTNSVLHSARRIYESAGYRLIDESPHHSFGHDLVGQTWELTLD